MNEVNKVSNNETCPISNFKMKHVFDSLLLKEHTVKYYFCEDCGFLKTEKPYWLKEAYSEAIASTDTGILQRNLQNKILVLTLSKLLFKPDSMLLDISGGYGILTRLLRDCGLNCYTTDKYCQNLVAKYFEPGPDFKADLLLLFEVMEHIEAPLEFLQENFTKYNCKNLLFTTLPFANQPPSKDWWYYSFETGQHISFYQVTTFHKIAEKLHLNYYQLNQCIHYFSEQKITGIRRLIITNKYLFRMLSVLSSLKKLPGKTLEDHTFIKSKLHLQ
jgi:Methyltransferase domain